MVVLRGMSWDHPRGVGALRAATEAYGRLRPGGVRVEWDARSLRDFEDVPIAELAARYDLIAMDHPYVGQAHATSALVPLEEVLDADVLAQARTHSGGPSHASYTWEGRQWALGVDAACQVSAYHPDLLDAAPPTDWPGVLGLLRELPPGAALLPANPTHLLCSWLTLCAQHAGQREGWLGAGGFDRDVALPAAELLVKTLELTGARSLGTDPVQALGAMAEGRVSYVPLVFGYVTYARDGGPVRFGAAPTPDGAPGPGLLGGVGLALSAACRHREEAADFLAYVVGEECQRGVYTRSGGQPGDRRAWTDPALDAECGGFLSATLPTLERAAVRPRHAAWPLVHRRAGEEVHRLVRKGAGAGEMLARFDEVCAATYAEAEGWA